MAYSGHSEVRLIGYGNGNRLRVARPFETEWECDPCTLPARRYRVWHSAGWREHAWHEVILPHDDARTRWLKLDLARRIDAAQDAVYAAQREYLRLTRGW